MPDHALPNTPARQSAAEWIDAELTRQIQQGLTEGTFSNNQVTILAEERLSLAAMRPSAPSVVQEVVPNQDHPATFSVPVLAAIETLLDRQSFTGMILDPFAGTGGIHALSGTTRSTVGVEIEPEWAACHRGTMVGDALHLDRLDLPVIDAIVTSPCYGNRMADTYRGQNDTCTECAGTGRGDGETLGVRIQIQLCTACAGSGRRPSRRHGYAVSLGRDPSDGSSSAMQWGQAYRDFHLQAVRQWASLFNRQAAQRLSANPLLIVNISDHIRNRQEQGVHLWWASILGSRFGVSFTAVPVQTRRQREGQNGEARVSCEWLLWARV